MPGNLPRGIRQRNNRYFVDITVAGVRKTATCRTLEEAIETRKELSEILRGNRISINTWTLAKAFEEAQLTPAPRGWRGQKNASKTIRNAQAALDYFGPDRKLDSITSVELEAYCRYLEDTLHNAGATVNRKLAALSKMMKLAVYCQGLDKRPEFPRRKEGIGRIRFLSHSEEAELLTHFQQTGRPDMADLVAVLIDTGFRVGECLSLAPDNVDIGQKQITLWVTKNGRPRTVPMTARVQRIIKKRLPALFPMTYESVRHYWDKARNQLGYGDDPHYVIHICRHTCASRLVQAGVPIQVVQEWMGHASVVTTQRYAHLAPRQLHQAVKALEGGSGGQEPALRVVK